MVLNKRDLERAFSPNKLRRSGGQGRSLNKGGHAGNQTSSSMRVVVRIRPQNAKELENNARSVIQVIDGNMLIFDPKEETEPFFYHGSRQNCRDLQKKQNRELEFGFDQVFGCDSSNVAVFEGSTKDMVKSLLDGYNCSVFAYGATGAGKTFTMLGSKTSPGITYLTIVELYRQMEILSNEKEFDLGISHLEVYNENVRDLIRPSGPLHLREDNNYGVRIPGLSIHRIKNADDLFALMAQGNRNRTQHPTDANAESSRSHSVFQLYIRMTNKLDRAMKIMKLSMIDLAGSERAAATGCRGMRFTEGANINKSLLALGNCINSLADGLKHIPYRDSKLTRLLKDCLGGNCQTVMIANVSPSSTSYEDTYNTLKYATRAKKIKQMMKKNIISVQLNASQYAKVVESLTAENEKLKMFAAENAKVVESLTAENEKLKLKLKMYEAENGSREGASTSAVAPAVLPNCKDKLSASYQELEAMNREISKLLKEIKLFNWRNCVKQKIADRLPCLSINMIHLEKRLNRIRTSMRQLEGREMSCKQKLRESIIKRNEHFEKTKCVIKELDRDGTNTELKQYVAMLQLQLELEDKKMQLEHCQQLLFMQQNELESEDIIVKEMCNTLKQYCFLLQGHNITTDAMISHYDELVHKLEGFKQISWKEDQETGDVNNFTFSIAELSRQSLCLEGTVKTEPSADMVILESVVDCTAKSNSCPSIMLTTASLENETSENESEVSDTEQCGDIRSDRMFEGTTDRVLLSANEIIAGSDSMSGVTGSSTNSCVTLETGNVAGLLPIGQTSLPENTQVSEVQRVKDEPAEYCGTLKELNLPVERTKDIVAQCSLMPLKVDCNTVVPNDYITQGSVLNDTFVLPRTSPLRVQVKTPGRLVQRSNTQSKVQITVNGPGSIRKRSTHAELASKLCNKENQAAAMRVKPSASCQRGGYNGSKGHTFTVPGVPQLRTSKPSMHRLTPASTHYKNPVTNQELGKMAYMKQRKQLTRAHPYVAD